MFGIGGWELLVIIGVALLVLGPKRLPTAARAVGRVATQLRKATGDLRKSIELDPEMEDLPRTLDELGKPIIVAGPTYAPRKPIKRRPVEEPPPMPRGDLAQEPPAPSSPPPQDGLVESSSAKAIDPLPPEPKDESSPMPRGDLAHAPEEPTPMPTGDAPREPTPAEEDDRPEGVTSSRRRSASSD